MKYLYHRFLIPVTPVETRYCDWQYDSNPRGSDAIKKISQRLMFDRRQQNWTCSFIQMSVMGIYDS